MTDSRGKRAVIISNIKSNSIEQAIFILKSPDACTDVGSNIVAEAQEIINNYIKKVERATPLRARRRKRRNFFVAAATVCVAIVLGIFAVIKL